MLCVDVYLFKLGAEMKWNAHTMVCSITFIARHWYHGVYELMQYVCLDLSTPVQELKQPQFARRKQ